MADNTPLSIDRELAPMEVLALRVTEGQRYAVVALPLKKHPTEQLVKL